MTCNSDPTPANLDVVRIDILDCMNRKIKSRLWYLGLALLATSMWCKPASQKQDVDVAGALRTPLTLVSGKIEPVPTADTVQSPGGYSGLPVVTCNAGAGSAATALDTNGLATCSHVTIIPVSPYWGDGADGALHYDGIATVLGVVPSGNVYDLNRVVNCTTLLVDAPVTIRFRNFWMTCTGTATINGLIGNIGNNGSGRVPGSSIPTGAYATSSTPTGGAGAFGVGAGGAAGGTANSPTTWSASASAPAGANGGQGQGGGGGSVAGFAGGIGGAVGIASVNLGRVSAETGFSLNNRGNGTAWDYASGGGGGAVLDGSGTGGGGGGPGALTFFAAPKIIGSGTISSRGGNAGTAALGGGATAAAGGAGGGGGWTIVVYGTRTGGTVTFDAAGGLGTAGAGTGGTGGNGGAGTVTGFNLSGDGT